MRTAVVFYSFGGSTRRYAQNIAKERDAELIEVKEEKKRGIFGAFFKGCPDAIKGKPSKLSDEVKLGEFERVIVMSPVWAGFPAPACNAIMQLIPKSARMELILVSGDGSTAKNHDEIIARINAMGINLADYRDIKSEQQK